MLLIRRSAAVKKDFKRLQKRGSDMSRLRNVVASLAAGEKLDEQYHDHPLKGKFAGFRECHLAPDWLLVYLLTEDELALTRTGTHADLFRS